MARAWMVAMVLALGVWPTWLFAAEMGLDLSDSGSTAPTVDLSSGPPVVLIPPHRASKLDLVAFRALHTALQAHLHSRLVAENATLDAINQGGLPVGQLTSKENLTKLMETVQAEQAIVLQIVGHKLEVSVYAKVGEEPAAHLTLAWSKRVDAARAKAAALQIVQQASQALAPPAPMPVAEEPAAPLPMVSQEGATDLDSELKRERPSASHGGRPTVMQILVGPGTTFRSFSTTGSQIPVPKSSNGVFTLGVDLAVYPLRLIPSLRHAKGADLMIEGAYRRAFASATLHNGDTSQSCTIDDDEVLGRAAWLYPLGGRLPRVGLAVGMAWERASFKCGQPVMSTRYRAVETHLRVAQTILPRLLSAELSAGPRFIISKHDHSASARGYSGEFWLTTQPWKMIFARGGLRVTNAQLTDTDKVAIKDTRTFLGVEVGAAL